MHGIQLQIVKSTEDILRRRDDIPENIGSHRLTPIHPLRVAITVSDESTEAVGGAQEYHLPDHRRTDMETITTTAEGSVRGEQ